MGDRKAYFTGDLQIVKKQRELIVQSKCADLLRQTDRQTNKQPTTLRNKDTHRKKRERLRQNTCKQKDWQRGDRAEGASVRVGRKARDADRCMPLRPRGEASAADAAAAAVEAQSSDGRNEIGRTPKCN